MISVFFIFSTCENMNCRKHAMKMPIIFRAGCRLTSEWPYTKIKTSAFCRTFFDVLKIVAGGCAQEPVQLVMAWVYSPATTFIKRR